MRYIISAFFFCFLSFSQTNDTIYNKAKNMYNFSLKLDSLSKTNTNFNYIFKANNPPLFSVYNHNTQLNDIYYFPKSSIYFVKSININTNQFIKKDSFNPHGASNFGAGVIISALNSIYKYSFKL